MPPPLAGSRTGLVFTGVAMEVAADGAPATVQDGLTVRLTADGIVVEPRAGAGRTVPWPRVEGARCGEHGFLHDGAPAVAIAATVGGRLVRFLVPSEQLPPDRASAVDMLLATRSAVDRTPPYWAPEPLQPQGAGSPPPGPSTNGSPGTPGGSHAGGAGEPPVPGSSEERVAGTEPVIAPVFRTIPRRPPGRPVGVASAGSGATAARVPPATGPAVTPAPAPGPVADQSSRTLLVALWTLLALLVALAVILGIGLARQPASPAGTRGPSAASSARLLAVELNVAKSDFPAGWHVDTSVTGPLTGLLSAGVGTPGGGLAGQPPAGRAQRRQEAAVAARFSRCMGFPPSDDRVLGSGGPAPLAREGSPAYAQPNGQLPMEAGSVTSVYASPVPVTEGLDQVRASAFASCFAAAVATQVQAAAEAAPTGAATTYGTPTVHTLSLPHTGRVRATGVDLDFPVSVKGSAATVQLGFCFVGGGRVATTVFTFGTVTGFPATLAARLVADVEHAMGGRARATGA